MKYTLQARNRNPWIRSTFDDPRFSLERNLDLAKELASNSHLDYRVVDELGNVVTDVPEEPKTAGTGKYIVMAVNPNHRSYDSLEEAQEVAKRMSGYRTGDSFSMCVLILNNAYKTNIKTIKNTFDITKEFTGG